MKTREEYAKLAEGHATVALTSNSAVSATVALTYATLATVAPWIQTVEIPGGVLDWPPPTSHGEKVN